MLWNLENQLIFMFFSSCELQFRVKGFFLGGTSSCSLIFRVRVWALSMDSSKSIKLMFFYVNYNLGLGFFLGSVV